MHMIYHSLNMTGFDKTVLLGTKMTAKPINKSLKRLYSNANNSSLCSYSGCYLRPVRHLRVFR